MEDKAQRLCRPRDSVVTVAQPNTIPTKVCVLKVQAVFFVPILRVLTGQKKSPPSQHLELANKMGWQSSTTPVLIRNYVPFATPTKTNDEEVQKHWIEISHRQRVLASNSIENDRKRLVSSSPGGTLQHPPFLVQVCCSSFEARFSQKQTVKQTMRIGLVLGSFSKPHI